MMYFSVRMRSLWYDCLSASELGRLVSQVLAAGGRGEGSARGTTQHNRKDFAGDGDDGGDVEEGSALFSSYHYHHASRYPHLKQLSSTYRERRRQFLQNEVFCNWLTDSDK